MNPGDRVLITWWGLPTEDRTTEAIFCETRSPNCVVQLPSEVYDAMRSADLGVPMPAEDMGPKDKDKKINCMIFHQDYVREIFDCPRCSSKFARPPLDKGDYLCYDCRYGMGTEQLELDYGIELSTQEDTGPKH
jgi:hypothetical protein